MVSLGKNDLIRDNEQPIVTLTVPEHVAFMSQTTFSAASSLDKVHRLGLVVHRVLYTKKKVNPRPFPSVYREIAVCKTK